MAEHNELHYPPSDCPNQGVCLTLLPRVESLEDNKLRHERWLERHEKALERIGKEVEIVKLDIREFHMLIKTLTFLRNLVLSLLAIGVVNVGTTIWFLSDLNSTVAQIAQKVIDYEARLRDLEKYNRIAP